MQTLSEMLRRAARLFPDKPFIIHNDRRLDYGDFDRLSSRLANVFREHGAGKGDPIGLYLPSCPELAVGYYACQKIGAIAVPMSVMYRGREVESIVGRTDMKLMLANAETLPVALETRQKLGLPREILAHGGPQPGALDADAELANASANHADAPCAPEDRAALFFTSGTTGAPKGAMQTQRSIYYTLRDMEVYNRFRFGREVLLGVLPIFNNFGATCLMNGAVYNCGTLVMVERWDTRKVLDAIARHRATFMAGTPTMFLYMLQEYRRDADDLSSMRLGVTGGAPVAPSLIDRWQETTGIPLTQIYGATESSGYVTGEPVVGHRKRGSAGLPFGSTEIAIVDDNGRELPAGQIGEVRIAGDTVGAGYWRDPETSARTFTPQGWLSGDLGYLDEEGYLFIVDRKKDIIISGGYNIYPLEVEEVLYAHPAVAVCALVGVPDPVKGEIPVACVILKDGVQAAEEELIRHCRDRIAAYKAPRRVAFMTEMPLGPSGKILKRELRRWAQEGRTGVS